MLNDTRASKKAGALKLKTLLLMHSDLVQARDAFTIGFSVKSESEPNTEAMTLIGYCDRVVMLDRFVRGTGITEACADKAERYQADEQSAGP